MIPELHKMPIASDALADFVRDSANIGGIGKTFSVSFSVVLDVVKAQQDVIIALEKRISNLEKNT